MASEPKPTYVAPASEVEPKQDPNCKEQVQGARVADAATPAPSQPPPTYVVPETGVEPSQEPDAPDSISGNPDRARSHQADSPCLQRPGTCCGSCEQSVSEVLVTCAEVLNHIRRDIRAIYNELSSHRMVVSESRRATNYVCSSPEKIVNPKSAKNATSPKTLGKIRPKTVTSDQLERPSYFFSRGDAVREVSQTGAFIQACGLGILGVNVGYQQVKRLHALIRSSPIESWEYEAALASMPEGSPKRNVGYFCSILESGRKQEVEKIELKRNTDPLGRYKLVEDEGDA